jgi:hypothetical protein
MSVTLFVDRHPVAMEADAVGEIKAVGEMESRRTFATVESVAFLETHEVRNRIPGEPRLHIPMSRSN